MGHFVTPAYVGFHADGKRCCKKIYVEDMQIMNRARCSLHRRISLSWIERNSRVEKVGPLIGRKSYGAFPKLGVPFLGVPRIRIIVFWGLY